MQETMREECAGSEAAFVLPPFYCPIAPAIHPRAAALEAQALKWVDSMGLCTGPEERARLIGSHAAEAVCRISPHADNEHLLLLSVLWHYWGFSIDEQQEGALRSVDLIDLAARLMGCLEAPGSGLLGDSPHAHALEDIVRRIALMCSPSQARRFENGLRRWLMGVLWEAANRERKTVPTLDEFLVQRLSTSGGAPVFALTEIVNGMELDANVIDSPAVRTVIEAVTLVTSFDNDLYSYAKEHRLDSEAGQDAVTVMARHHHCDIPRAVDHVVALRDQAMVFFLRLRHSLLAHAEPALARFLDDLGHSIRSNIDWSAKAPRYIGASTPQPIRWATTPTESTTPPPASISWWWTPEKTPLPS
ncbi:hypothetical protein ACFC0S_00195 [Streptomyces sp. NPDC056084]|uniref:terpene synthase family protein n=1 Tax=unclassified Streptomyces TaxID=2593676 RepID=UPI0035E122A0